MYHNVDFIFVDKLTGMNENSGKVSTASSLDDIKSAILSSANFGLVQSTDESCLRFSALTYSGKVPVLLTVYLKDGTAIITSNCEKMVFGSMILKLAKETVSSL